MTTSTCTKSALTNLIIFKDASRDAFWNIFLVTNILALNSFKCISFTSSVTYFVLPSVGCFFKKLLGLIIALLGH